MHLSRPCRGGVFAVGSLVRVSLRPVAKKNKNIGPPKFLPYEVLESARYLKGLFSCEACMLSTVAFVFCFLSIYV
jgi:hypothetical protein